MLPIIIAMIIVTAVVLSYPYFQQRRHKPGSYPQVPMKKK